MTDDRPSLRERKQQRAREAIREAALQLFAERGYDKVTVADIAARAEVGRATFFRYFGDKQEVIFGRDQDLGKVPVTDAEQLQVDSPIGDSLPTAVALVRELLLAYMARLVERPDAYVRHERLVAEHAELHARSLTKQRRYAEGVAQLLEQNGADRETATIAAEFGMACFYAGRELCGNDPHKLVDAIDSAFSRLTTPRRARAARQR